MIKVVKHLGGAFSIDGVSFDKVSTKITGNKLVANAQKIVQPSGKVVKTKIETNCFAVVTEK